MTPLDVARRADKFAKAYWDGKFLILEQAIAAAIVEDRGYRQYAPLDISGLTKRQADAYGFICEYAAEHGYSPSFDEIKDHLGLNSKSGVHRIVHGLKRRGAIDFLPDRARSIRILDSQTAKATEAGREAA